MYQPGNRYHMHKASYVDAAPILVRMYVIHSRWPSPAQFPSNPNQLIADINRSLQLPVPRLHSARRAPASSPLSLFLRLHHRLRQWSRIKMNVNLTVKNCFWRSEKGRLLHQTAAARTRGDWGRCSPSRGTWPAIPSSTPCKRGTCLPKIGTRHWSTCTRLVRARSAPRADPPHVRTNVTHTVYPSMHSHDQLSLRTSIHTAAVQIRLDGGISDCRQFPRSLFGAKCNGETRTARYCTGLYSDGSEGHRRRAISARSG